MSFNIELFRTGILLAGGIGTFLGVSYLLVLRYRKKKRSRH